MKYRAFERVIFKESDKTLNGIIGISIDENTYRVFVESENAFYAVKEEDIVETYKNTNIEWIREIPTYILARNFVELTEDMEYRSTLYRYFHTDNYFKHENIDKVIEFNKQWLESPHKALEHPPIIFTEAERALLKRLDSKFQYLAKDGNGDVYAYTVAPTKIISEQRWTAWDNTFQYVANGIVRLISSSDHEPFAFREYL